MTRIRSKCRSRPPGDVLAIHRVVGNVPADLVTAISTSPIIDSTKLSVLGGAFNNILAEASCAGFLCSPATLPPGIGAPIAKPNDPNSLATGTTPWIQAVAHTNVSGTTGQGPGQSGDPGRLGLGVRPRRSRTGS